MISWVQNIGSTEKIDMEIIKALLSKGSSIGPKLSSKDSKLYNSIMNNIELVEILIDHDQPITHNYYFLNDLGLKLCTENESKFKWFELIQSKKIDLTSLRIQLVQDIMLYNMNYPEIIKYIIDLDKDIIYRTSSSQVSFVERKEFDFAPGFDVDDGLYETFRILFEVCDFKPDYSSINLFNFIYFKMPKIRNLLIKSCSDELYFWELIYQYNLSDFDIQNERKGLKISEIDRKMEEDSDYPSDHEDPWEYYF